ncbi:MAG TPA: hypothetical protein VGI75_05585 [Pirellulales bacterium]|jgi:hypothetical protein
MKRFITISAAVVLGTLAFNVTLARASNGNKDNKNKHESESKHSKHDDCFKDFWKNLCYDFTHGCGHDHCGSGTTEHMGGSNYGPPGTPENPTPVSGTTIPPKGVIHGPIYPVAGGPLNGLHNPLRPSPTKTSYPFKVIPVQMLKKQVGNQPIPNIGTGFKGFAGGAGQIVGGAVTSGLNAVGSVVGGVAKGVESIGGGVASAVGDIGSGIAGAIGDIF